MRSLSPLASLANVFRIPMSMAPARPSVSRACQETLARASPATGQSAPFSSTSTVAARQSKGPMVDKRINLYSAKNPPECFQTPQNLYANPLLSPLALIRYFLYHPLTPRPLRFSRNRYLRHWTIHRAWQLLQAKQRRNQELELQRQYQSMHAACEELRTGAGDGGKLFRVAMNKKGVFSEMFPIEYGRMQTDYPRPRVGTMSGNALRRSTRCLFEDRYTMR
ncbi:hypothetical protein N7470_002091 [Penicillium chermesinum]|nr:hypothetical protein N7470_002091 [Penicillium chermesinum]